MVKCTFIIASVAAAASVTMAQQPTAIPSDLVAAASSLLANPSAANSLLSMASVNANQLPTQYQASLHSVIAQASKTLAAAEAAKSGTKSGAVSSHPASFIVGTLAFTAVVASLM